MDARDDTATVLGNIGTVIDVLENDTTDSGTPLRVIHVNQPPAGTVDLTGNRVGCTPSSTGSATVGM